MTDNFDNISGSGYQGSGGYDQFKSKQGPQGGQSADYHGVTNTGAGFTSGQTPENSGHGLGAWKQGDYEDNLASGTGVGGRNQSDFQRGSPNPGDRFETGGRKHDNFQRDTLNQGQGGFESGRGGQYGEDAPVMGMYGTQTGAIGGGGNSTTGNRDQSVGLEGRDNYGSSTGQRRDFPDQTQNRPMDFNSSKEITGHRHNDGSLLDKTKELYDDIKNTGSGGDQGQNRRH